MVLASVKVQSSDVQATVKFAVGPPGAGAAVTLTVFVTLLLSAVVVGHRELDVEGARGAIRVRRVLTARCRIVTERP